MSIYSYINSYLRPEGGVCISDHITAFSSFSILALENYKWPDLAEISGFAATVFSAIPLPFAGNALNPEMLTFKGKNL